MATTNNNERLETRAGGGNWVTYLMCKCGNVEMCECFCATRQAPLREAKSLKEKGVKRERRDEYKQTSFSLIALREKTAKQASLLF